MCRLALACYVLSLGFAIASPLVFGTEAQALCSSAGVSLVAVPADSDQPQTLTHKLDCPLCGLGFGLLPESGTLVVVEVSVLTEAPPPALSSPQSHVFRAWQARAPPES
jgi:hypothetical protein